MTSSQPADEFAPVAVHERLDRRGLLDDAHNSGCYAISLDVPDCRETAVRQWLAEFDAMPGDDAIERLAEAARVAYVGASGHVYDRLMDHARADVRKASVLRVFAPTRVERVWPSATPFDRERSRAYELVRDGWTCYTDGEVLG